MLRSDTDSPTPIVCSTDPDDDDDDVLSVGCESPPPASASASTSDQDSLSNQAAQPTSKAGSPNALSFSIDNILRPEFGTHPVDLTKHKAPTPKSAAPATQPSPAPSPPEMLWPAWVYCTRYSDRPSSGRSPRTRRSKRKEKKGEEKRPRTAFSGDQLSRLKSEFSANRYLTEKRRQALAGELNLNEAQIKIWFQNKRAKIKKATGSKNPLALQLMAQGLYNHSTVPLSKDEQQQSADTDSENTSYL